MMNHPPQGAAIRERRGLAIRNEKNPKIQIQGTVSNSYSDFFRAALATKSSVSNSYSDFFRAALATKIAIPIFLGPPFLGPRFF